MNTNQSQDLIISVKPKFVKLMKSGKKTTELRKTLPSRAGMYSRMFVWETSPKKHLTGVAVLFCRCTNDPDTLWRQTSKTSGVSKKEFVEYFKGYNYGHGLEFTDFQEFPHKISLSEMKTMINGFHPPQGYYYVSDKNSDLLLRLGGISR